MLFMYLIILYEQSLGGGFMFQIFMGSPSHTPLGEEIFPDLLGVPRGPS